MAKQPRAASPSPGLPSRVVVSHPPAVWLARLKQELVAVGIEHDSASLVARRVLTALLPQAARLEAMDHRAEKFQID